MKKIFHFDKKGRVKSYSDKKIETEKLDQIELNISKADFEKIKSNNYDIFIKNKKLILKENQRFLDKKAKEAHLRVIEKIKNNSHTNKDLAKILEAVIKYGKNNKI